jgi:hypothetical protein
MSICSLSDFNGVSSGWLVRIGYRDRGRPEGSIWWMPKVGDSYLATRGDIYLATLPRISTVSSRYKLLIPVSMLLDGLDGK